ncbi:MAG: CTP synthase [Candidatus Latescibacteria bacterium]|nr:CTP synthase [Candidatus Latescibacterota bacterium]
MSGVGKGLTTASMGKILNAYGYSTTAVKIDPYINYDAGTLRPTEHGEVWVTDDGGEIDQDLGNYERFLGIDIPRQNNLTTGQIYHTVIERERRGEYLGQTVQPIPHITDEIKRRIQEASKGFDIGLIEIGGTVGDYENDPFLFAVKGLEREIGEEHFVFVLITYLPVPPHVGEMKTKPTQQAIRMLSENGIFPDFIVCRAEQSIDEVRKKKIQIGANVPTEHIISAPDTDTIYDIPLTLEAEDLGSKVLAKLGWAPKSKPDWGHWEDLVRRSREPRRVLKVAMVGKYAESGEFQFTDSYLSVNQSLVHAGVASDAKVEITWIDGHRFEDDPAELSILDQYSGIIVPGAFGGGADGVMMAIRHAREHKVPYLGLCYGLQLAVIEFAINVAGITEATSEEFTANSDWKIVSIQESQKEVLQNNRYGGSMRLGAYAAVLKKDSMVLELYQRSGRLDEDAERVRQLLECPEEAFRVGEIMPDRDKIVLERHRHRYEISPRFVELLEEEGLLFSGYHRRIDGTRLMEFIELSDHPFFVATQAHPEFKSRMDNPAPLFSGFVDAALAFQERRDNQDNSMAAS